ncbi:angiotensin-converting enzyme [Patella vulgata]|uniref:angiotensin-converting enzyme n=1 Tax=Patella vulgata TaxID=6465 RepID=UPI00217FFF5D|nr:angiotensin-converting enzyme [Patella vulgata]XP_050407172.1 angiotensin-converting enzyme [Patella vulgata]XP_050407174.1 angiotensin-converting enzyme [Patella vulgata]
MEMKCVLVFVLLTTTSILCDLITDEEAARQFFEDVNTKSEEVNFRYVSAAWTYNTNITQENQEAMVAESLRLAEFDQEVAHNASQFYWSNFTDTNLRRIFSRLVDIGTAAMPDTAKLERLNQIQSEMRTIYSTGQVCLSESECLPLDPDLTRLFAESRDYDRLLAAWQGWRDVSGKKMKDLYEEFVALSNEAIVANGYEDTGAYWRSWYDTPTFEEDLVDLFETLKPLYVNLHAYTRNKLKEFYGADKFPSTGQIPAHLLGNMWAQTWNNLYDVLEPYKNKDSIDVTPEMIRQNFTAVKMFEVSDEFFESLGMIKMPDRFWNYSMLSKPEDRDVVCHASAWDFYNRQDFRVKQCTEINMEDLITVHHEMGHIEYYLQYKDQPVVFRGGANPGFHEAVGDVISLSVQTPKHLEKIDLIQNVTNDNEADINFLMRMALQKIAFLPFGYLIDQWRWSVFSGETPKDKYNEKWWDLRCKYQGVSPPVTRTEEDFDPASKFHIPNNTPYIRYFVSFVIQFQFHKALCNAASQTGPLHQCDIYQNQQAGQLLSEMLKLGSSLPWPEAMVMVSGEDKMNATALMEYFQPLTDWLQEQNGDDIGWEDACPAADTKDPSSSNMNFISLPLIMAAVLYSLLKIRN